MNFIPFSDDIAHLRQEGDHLYGQTGISSVIKKHKSCLQEQVSQVQEEVDRDCLTSTIEYICYCLHIVHLLHNHGH